MRSWMFFIIGVRGDCPCYQKVHQEVWIIKEIMTAEYLNESKLSLDLKIFSPHRKRSFANTPLNESYFLQLACWSIIH
jgi:hypothetical protein